MRLHRPTTHPAARINGHRRRVLSRLVLPLFAVCATAARAQQPPPSDADASPVYTLHLYTRLVEMPTIVLPPDHHLPKPKDVFIKFDSDQPFHPSSLRLEGDDPLSLAVLIDTQGGHSPLLTAFQQSFSAWLTSSFQPQDRISLYAAGCQLFNGGFDRPPNPVLLSPALGSIAATAEADQKENRDCHQRVGFRDDVAFIMKQISALPGRRVLLILTNGEDNKGVIKWHDLTADTALYAVTVIALNVPDPMIDQWGGSLNMLLQRSGGMYISTPPQIVPNLLPSLIHMLRNRYVLQFSMPANLMGGIHDVTVKINAFTSLVRPSGITIPLNDPTTKTGPVDTPLVPTPTPPTPPQATPSAPPTPNR